MIGFGRFGKRNLGINSLSDERLVKIDTTTEGFYDNVLNYSSKNGDIQAFIGAVREVQEVGVEPFYRPVMDPSLEDGNVVFKKWKPAVGYSFNFWKHKAEEMPAVEGKRWHIGSEYQYYAFLTWLINQLVATGQGIKGAIEAVVLDSKELGHYRNAKNALQDFETTGSREVCGVYDLANAYKLLACSNEEAGGFWVAGGDYRNFGDNFPLAGLDNCDGVDYGDDYGVGWLVLA